MNYLIGWEENNIKQWNVVKKSDLDNQLLNLMDNENVEKSSIFIIPSSNIMAGIWLYPHLHKSNRVDFFRFHEDYGEIYVTPEVSEKHKEIIDDYNEKYGYDTKHGWISPDEKYFHCEYQGHTNLADKICFGMIDTNNSEKYLEEHGWLKIYKSLLDTHYSVYTGGNNVITDAQMKTLIKMDLDNAKGISEMLCKKKEEIW